MASSRDDDDAPSAAFLAAAHEWSRRLDRFCDDLEAHGFGVERDDFSVKITLPEGEQQSTENGT